MKKRSSLKIGSIVSYLSIFFEIVAGFFYVPWMISQLGQSDYGIYSLAAAITSILSIDLGLSAAASKFVAKYRAEGNHEMANNVASLITKIFIVFDSFILVLITVVFFLLDSSFSAKFTPSELSSLKVVYLIIGVYSIVIFPSSPVAGYLNGNDKFTTVRIINLLTKVFTIGLIVVGLLLGFGLYGFVFCNCIVTILSRLIMCFVFYGKNNFGNKLVIKYWDKHIFGEVVRYILWSGLSVLSEKIIVYSVPYILGMFCGTSTTSVFQVGLTIDNYYVIITTAIDGFFIARLSEMSEQKLSPEEFTDYWIKAGRMQLLVSALFFIGFLSIGNDFMKFWLSNNIGADPKSSYYVALIMMVPGLISSTHQIGNTLLIVKNKIRFRAVGYLISSFICVSFTVLLVSLNVKNAPIMAALSVAAGRSFLAPYSLIIFRTKLKLNVFRFLRKTYFSVALYAILTIVFAIGLNRLIPNSGWLVIGMKAIIIALFYLVFLWFSWLTEDEKRFLLPKKLFRKSLR